ncbi:hypothetical protein ACOMHN_039709 [Nucella lapillus]
MTNVTVTLSPQPNGSQAETTAQREVVVFSTWVDRPYKRLIHDNVLRSWPLVSPHSFICMLFSEEAERARARTYQWTTPPLPPKACGGIPIFREMFYAAMKAVPAARLFGFANGDILLGATLKETLHALLNSSILMSQPLLLLVRRFNVGVSDKQLLVKDLRTVEVMKNQGSRVEDGSSDVFFTNRLFPWGNIADVVPGRIGIGMWLVTVARALNVTVIDLTDTVTAVHLTSSAGNLESHGHPNASCNHELYKRLGVVPTSWGCGYIHCAGYSSRFVNDSTGRHVQFRSKAEPMFCHNCQINMTALLKLNSKT